MVINECTYNDLDILADLNKQLIDDENSNNNMSIEELKERMNGFISTTYKAFLFLIEDNIYGYALVNIEKNPYYLRQFFIVREFRQNGYGKKALSLLLDELKTTEIDLEVLSNNERGISFWRSCGFREYSKYMKLT